MEKPRTKFSRNFVVVKYHKRQSIANNPLKMKESHTILPNLDYQV